MAVWRSWAATCSTGDVPLRELGLAAASSSVAAARGRCVQRSRAGGSGARVDATCEDLWAQHAKLMLISGPAFVCGSSGSARPLKSGTPFASVE
jgi:hypothetical protein